jgi:hypothetical protein
MRAICSTPALLLVGTLAALLGGCDKLFGLARVNDTAIDAPVDGAPIDALCLGQGILAGLCLESPPPMVNLTSAIDTSSDPKCRVVQLSTAPELCVIEAIDITVSETVIVTGARPLVLLAANNVEIANALDASSRRTLRVGAGAQTSCRGGNGMDGGQAGGGGAGGTFGYPGGPGGTGQSGTSLPATGGMPTSVVPQTAVYGGCEAGKGGMYFASTSARAAGGAGGGAVYVIAGAQIHIATTGSINASGAGGEGAAKMNGGGGGGSGGLIALDAPLIVVEGSLYARGGAGGGGGGSTTAGAPGGEASGPSGAISGGSAGISGGTGGGDGCGAPLGQQGGITSSAQVGGGGGGGGCGRIRLYGTKDVSGLVNPAPT